MGSVSDRRRCIQHVQMRWRRLMRSPPLQTSVPLFNPTEYSNQKPSQETCKRPYTTRHADLPERVLSDSFRTSVANSRRMNSSEALVKYGTIFLMIGETKMKLTIATATAFAMMLSSI